MFESKEEPEDFLEVDAPLPGQNYVCLSFVSPEDALKRKEHFFMKSFLESLDSLPSDITTKYDDFVALNEKSLDETFFKESGFQTSVRGLKVRGSYNTYEEAQKRAKQLQQLDRAHHVYVAQVGYWLPWNPSADGIAEQEYLEKELNELMQNYKSNQVQRDVFYAKQVEEHKRNAAETLLAHKNSNETSTTEDSFISTFTPESS